MLLHDSTLRRRRIGRMVWNVVTTGMRSREEVRRCGSRFAAENAEFVLQGHDVEMPAVQVFRRLDVIADRLILDAEPDRRGIFVGAAVVRHGNDAVSKPGRAAAIAACRSWVKVAIRSAWEASFRSLQCGTGVS